jgi:hypothetical protein
MNSAVKVKNANAALKMSAVKSKNAVLKQIKSNPKFIKQPSFLIGMKMIVNLPITSTMKV